MRIKNPSSLQPLKTPSHIFKLEETSLSTAMHTSTHVLPMQPSVVTAVVRACRAVVRAVSLLILEGRPDIVPVIRECPTAQYRLSANVVLLVSRPMLDTDSLAAVGRAAEGKA
jgi:hypothetical protein